MYIWAKYFCQLVFLQFGSKLNLYVQYSKIEIYLEIRGCDNLNVMRDRGRRDQGRFFANSKVPVVLPNITKIISVPGRY